MFFERYLVVDVFCTEFYDSRMATPAKTSSDIPQSKYCFRKLPLIYHPKDQNQAFYNSEMPEKLFSLTKNA